MPATAGPRLNLSDEKLTTAQSAALLTISPGTLRYWRHQGIGPRYIRIGGAIRYLRSDIEQWVDQQNADPAA